MQKKSKINDAKTKSRDYFNNHRRSKLAGGGYWRHDYKYAFSIIKKIKYRKISPFTFQCIAKK